jgi:hypothetical protein
LKVNDFMILSATFEGDWKLFNVNLRIIDRWSHQ